MILKITAACSLFMLALSAGAQGVETSGRNPTPDSKQQPMSGAAIKPQAIKPIARCRTNVNEPSDIAYNADFTQMYIVNDNGTLFKTDTLGKKIEMAGESGLDFEGLCFYNGLVYVTDERARRVIGYTPDDMKIVRQNELAYLGGMNQAYEAITYNPVKNCFVVVTEKNPCWLFELNNDLVKINEKKMRIASDLSGLSFHNGFIYALSDEDQMVLKLDPSDYSVVEKWAIPVTNPEGITFDKAGNLVVLSDVEQRIYKFKIN